MPSTQESREAYRDHLGGFYRSGTMYGRPYVKKDWRWPKVRFYAAGPYAKGYVDLAVHPVARGAMRALAAVFLHHRYAFRETAGGTVSLRNITGATSYRIALQVEKQFPYATSLHAHGLALDINPSKNPYGSSRPDELDERRWQDMILDAKQIRTNWPSARVFKWGGDWTVDDDMHFEATYCNRTQLTSGIATSTVVGWADYLAWVGDDSDEEVDDMPFLPMEKGDGFDSEGRGFKREDVMYLQSELRRCGEAVDVDGYYGDGTAAAVGKLTSTDGTRVGGKEWDLIFSRASIRHTHGVEGRTT